MAQCRQLGLPVSVLPVVYTLLDSATSLGNFVAFYFRKVSYVKLFIIAIGRSKERTAKEKRQN